MERKSDRRNFTQEFLLMLGAGVIGGAVGPAVEFGFERYSRESRDFSTSFYFGEYPFAFGESATSTHLGQVAQFHLYNSGDFIETNVDGFVTASVQIDPRYGFQNLDDYRKMLGYARGGYTTEAMQELNVVADPVGNISADGHVQLSYSFSIPKILKGDGVVVYIYAPYQITDINVDGQSDELIFRDSWHFNGTVPVFATPSVPTLAPLTRG